MLRFLALVLLLAAPLAQAAVDPGARSQPAMTLDGAITAFDMAAGGTMVAGRADPAGTSGETAHLWRAWDADGTQRRSETADASNCVATPIVNECIGNVVDVAVSSSGERIVIAARDDNNAGRLVFATLSGGIVTRLEFPNEQPTAVAISDDGSRVVVSAERPGNPAQGRVRLFGWTAVGSGTVTATWAVDTTLPATRVALGPDGRVAAAAGDLHYRITTTASSPTTYVHDNDAVLRDVAYAAASSEQWSVAGGADGGVLLYSASEDTGTPSPREDLQQGSSAQVAVAITPDGRLFAAGDAAGVVRLYRNLHLVAGASPLVAATAALPGAVTSLAFSTDGRYLAVAAGTATLLFRTDTTGLHLMWQATSSTAVTGVDVNADASLVASTSGSAVTVFTTLRGATLTPPITTSIAPGHSRNVALQVRNAGNREETILLDAPVVPTGWTATLSATSVTLRPDQASNITMNLTAAALASPGPASVTLTHRIAGVSSVTTAIPVTVTQVRQWNLLAQVTSVAIEAGGSVRVPFVLVNQGNGPDATGVSVAVDRAGWVATLDRSTVQAAAGASLIANVTITAPADARQLEAGTATIQVDADAVAVLRVTATIGARFGSTVQVVPAEGPGVRGQATTFVVRVTNTGNAPDRFTPTLAAVPTGWLATFEPSLTATLGPGETAVLAGQVVPAAGAAAGSYELVVQLTSQSDASKVATATYTLQVEASSPSATSTGGRGSPAPAFLGLALGLLAVAALRRR